MRLLITGSRTWTDEALIFAVLADLQADYGLNITVISGHCRAGADLMCEKHAYKLGYDLELFPANWSRYGKNAGRIRNKKMVELHIDRCYAFIKNNSGGATQCANFAEAYGIKVERWTEE